MRDQFKILGFNYKPTTMSNQQHTPEPWEGITHKTLNSGLDFKDLEKVMSIQDYKRAKECVNAMEGIDDPELYVSKVNMMGDISKTIKERVEKLINEKRELQKYKTVCEGINPDNPMVVAERLYELIDFVARVSNSIHIDIAKDADELLTKIQSK